MMDGSMSVDKPVRRSVTLPSRYLEELDNSSSPGVVSKKAAFFEEVIRSASGEKKCTGSLKRSGTGPRSVSMIIDEVELSGMKDTTVRTLDFSSDSEGSSNNNEMENRPPEVNKLIFEEETLVVECLRSKVADDESDPPETTELTEVEDDPETELLQAGKPNETGESCEEAHAEEIKVVVTGCTHVEFRSSSSSEQAIEEKDEGDLSGSSDVSEPQQEELLKESKGVDCERPEQVLPPGPSVHELKVAKPQKAQKRTSGAKAGEIPSSQRGKAPVVRSSTAAAFQSKRGETIRSSVSELGSRRAGSRSLNPVSKSTSFTTPQPFTLGTEKRHLNSEESKVKQGSTKHDDSKQASTSSKDSRRRSVGAFHLKSEERAEKRKEFYMKLEERLSAKEQEKSQMKVKTQQEAMESELRKMRQSMTFKAKPMPSFYQGNTPPKNETKKAQSGSSRAVSPKVSKPRLNSKSEPGNSSNQQQHHHYHNVRLCQQHHLKPGKPPVSTTGRLSDVRSSRAGKVGVVASPPEKVGKRSISTEAGLGEKDSMFDAQVVGLMEDCSSILDLKEEDETLDLLAGSIAEPSSFSEQQA